MSDLPAASLAWLAAHHGVITTATLRAHKVGRSTIERLLTTGVLRRRAKAVFVIASAPATLEQRCAVLSAAHPRGFITGPTGGTLAGLRRMPTSSGIHVAVTHGNHHLTLPGIVWRQTTAIWSVDRTTRDDGIVVAAAARLAFDLAADLRPLDHLSIVHQLLDTGQLTVEDLVAIDTRLGHPARPGSGRFRNTIQAVVGHAAHQSHPELVLAEALRRRNVPVEHQVRVVRPSDGRPMYIDLAVRSAQWGVELDIHPEHRSLEGHAADAERRRTRPTGLDGSSRPSASTTSVTSSGSPASSPRSTGCAAGTSPSIRVFREGGPHTKHSDAPQHSDGGGVRSWGLRCGGRRRRRGPS